MASAEQPTVIVGAGVVGCATAFELARRGAQPLLLEAEERLGLGASAANSGILHTGFDSKQGELETRLILRAAQLRAGAADTLLGAPLLRCGARLRAERREQHAALAALASNAHANGVAVHEHGEDELSVPGEAVTDPLALLGALADAAVAAGAQLRMRARVARVAGSATGATLELESGERLTAERVVNCAGLGAGELARDGLEVYPRKGEFLVFEQPRGEELREILLPVPSAQGKGVLVFPTVDGHLIAGPTARDRSDRGDWSVEPDAAATILAKARTMFPPLENLEPIASYAGLRPAGRGFNYLIAPSRSVPAMLNVAAIRSTGLTAAAAIAEHVVAQLGDPAPAQPWPALAPREHAEPWWRVAARRSLAGTAP
ncbi:MAG TPA: FAD-dependent oxidoreductase [Solirubrobacteraceae bacterium]